MSTETSVEPAFDSTTSSWISPVVVPGREIAELERFHFDCTWTGSVEPGMMGPGSPFMEANGSAVFTRTDDGLWIRGEFSQDQFAKGELVLTWRAHYMTGWDPTARDYVAFMTDNCGHAGFMRGQISGDRLVLTTANDDAVAFRITWDVSNPEAATWIDEVSVAGGPWQLIESYVLSRSAR